MAAITRKITVHASGYQIEISDWHEGMDLIAIRWIDDEGKSDSEPMIIERDLVDAFMRALAEIQAGKKPMTFEATP